VILFACIGVKAHDAIRDLTSVGRGIQDSGRTISATTRDTAATVDGAFATAGDTVGGLPLVGEEVADALRGAPRDATSALRAAGDEQGSRIVRLGVEQVNQTETAANWVGWLVFALPAIVLLAFAIPKRVRGVIAMSLAQRTFSGAPEHILAARAAYSLPYRTLNRYTADPFGDLHAGRHQALLKALADDAGVKL